MRTEDIKRLAEAWQEVVSEKKLDPVDDKENDKKFKDRKDKDIDNDGDVDDSDEYLHKRRAATDDAIDARDGKKDDDEGDEKEDPKKKNGKTAEISKIGEKNAVKKEDVDMEELLVRLAEDFTEEQLDEISQGLAKKAFDARAARHKKVSDREKSWDRRADKDQKKGDRDAASAAHSIARDKGRERDDMEKKLDRSAKKAGIDPQKRYAQVTQSPSQRYQDYRKKGGELSMDDWKKRQRESFEIEVTELLNALEEAANPKKGATPPEGIMDKESPKSKEFADKHKVDVKKHDDMEKIVPNPKVKVKEDNRSYQQKIMDILNGKSWSEIAQEVDQVED